MCPILQVLHIKLHSSPPVRGPGEKRVFLSREPEVRRQQAPVALE
jgi:hypothetical protein